MISGIFINWVGVICLMISIISFVADQQSLIWKLYFLILSLLFIFSPIAYRQNQNTNDRQNQNTKNDSFLNELLFQHPIWSCCCHLLYVTLLATIISFTITSSFFQDTFNTFNLNTFIIIILLIVTSIPVFIIFYLIFTKYCIGNYCKETIILAFSWSIESRSEII